MATTIDTNLIVTGSLTWGGSFSTIAVPLSVAGLVEIGGSLSVTGAASATSVEVDGTTTFSAGLTVNDIAEVSTLTGPSTQDSFLEGVTVTGNLVISGPQTLEVTGATSFGTGGLQIEGVSHFAGFSAGGTTIGSSHMYRLTSNTSVTIGTDSRPGVLDIQDAYGFYIEAWATGGGSGKQVYVTEEGRLYVP